MNTEESKELKYRPTSFSRADLGGRPARSSPSVIGS
jgi:hypothetical protein